jgi:hypothetical protein
MGEGKPLRRQSDSLEGMDVRSMHPYAYRSGEWARIAHVYDHDGRRMWLVTFTDGDADWWVANDPDGAYEFREPSVPPDREGGSRG